MSESPMPGTDLAQAFGAVWDRLTNRDLVVQILAAMDSHDERLLDLQGQLNRLESFVTAAQDYIRAALDSLDVQMRDLQIRLQADADALRAAIEGANLNQAAQEELVAAADRIQATAVLVSGLAQPSAVADPDAPDEAGPLPSDDTTGGDTTGGDTTGGEEVPPAEGGDTPTV